MNFKNYFFIFFFTFILQVSAQTSEGSSFKKDYMLEIDAAKDKILSLIEAVPQDKFSWRPADDVRSISEVFMHVGGGNYFLLSLIGGSMPEGFNRDMEKTVTSKEEINEFVTNSYENIKNYISSLDESSLDDEVDFFGNKTSKRHLLFVIMDHNHEHLGQSIAYARINNISPPWSMK